MTMVMAMVLWVTAHHYIHMDSIVSMVLALRHIDCSIRHFDYHFQWCSVFHHCHIYSNHWDVCSCVRTFVYLLDCLHDNWHNVVLNLDPNMEKRDVPKSRVSTDNGAGDDDADGICHCFLCIAVLRF